ncbi:MAG TPA: BlaI/MecI/CopY family transcriptional regulator [Bryobacteraceae bacterium]|nr:BlaI/MecI/CopY family transcriptional regulator [Bryobacteraceae bacterium]
MPTRPAPSHLSRRERQILDILYQRGSAGVAEIQAGLPHTPSYSAVRALVRILEEKGHVKHEERDGRYVYTPRVSRAKASRSAVTHLVETFFNGSPEQAMAALLDVSARGLSREELDRLAGMIDKARKEGR